MRACGKMRRRKRYLDSSADIPGRTLRKLRRESSSIDDRPEAAADGHDAQEDDSPAPSSHTSEVQPPTALPNDDAPHIAGSQPAHHEEVEAELSDGDLLALTVNFVIEFGLPWKAVEALQKLMAYVLKRRGLPMTKYMFTKRAATNMDTAGFNFYCNTCKTLVAETSGRLAERNYVQGTCPSCGEQYSGRKMLLDGHLFVSLPIENQITSLLAEEEVAIALNKRLQEISDRQSSSAEELSDITD